MQHLRFLFAVVSFFAMIVMNALANSMSFNGLKTGDVSAIYTNNFVPAGFTFSIWGIIYLWLLLFLIALMLGLYVKGKETNVYISNSININTHVAWWFTLSNILNSVWIVCWHYLYIGLSLAVMVSLLFTIIKIYVSINEIGKGLAKWHHWILVKPFSLYLGWISVATIANTSAYFTSLKLEGVSWVMTLLNVEWPLTYLVVFVATALAITFIVKMHDIIYASVIVWALYGIASRWLYESSIQQLSTAVLFICMSLIFGAMALLIYKDKRIGFSK